MKISNLNLTNYSRLDRKAKRRIARKLLKEIDLLSIAKYNIGRENEIIGDYEAAYELYGQAVQVLESRDPPNEKLLSRFDKARTLVYEVCSLKLISSEDLGKSKKKMIITMNYL